jgi:SAM-dependent methyltransferase
MDLGKLTPEAIRDLSYNQLIGIVGETNRTPGGNESVHYIADRIRVDHRSSVLDIGTSTGATALELSRLTGCAVTGVDINEPSLDEARRRADLLGLPRARFDRADACKLPYADSTFDLVFCGNVTSLIEDGQRAFAEYRRVLKTMGYLAAIPMYYVKEPPVALVDRVRKAIQVNIAVKHRPAAVEFFQSPELELYDCADFHFDEVPKSAVLDFADRMLRQPRLQALSDQAKQALKETYTEHLLLFRDNLAHMGFTILILRRTKFQEDPPLFTSHRVR